MNNEGLTLKIFDVIVEYHEDLLADHKNVGPEQKKGWNFFEQIIRPSSCY